jgi:hypothetical protein
LSFDEVETQASYPATLAINLPHEKLHLPTGILHWMQGCWWQDQDY